MAWTRITDPEQAVAALPIWFGIRMIDLRGRFGPLLTSGDILRTTSITALHDSPHGDILFDVLFDHAGVSAQRLLLRAMPEAAGAAPLARTLASLACVRLAGQPSLPFDRP
jgi:hypothetical protein